MGIGQLVEQYQKQLNIVKRQIKEMEQTQAANIDRSKYRQLKQMKRELQSNICQLKKYTKKG